MKVFKLSTLLCLSFSTLLFSNEKSVGLDTYISDLKQREFRYSYEKNEAEGSKLRDSWIAPLHLNYNYSKSKPYSDELTNQSAAIKMDQPIFQSGGIYYGIKFANFSKLYADLSVDVAKRKMIKESISLLMQIKKRTLQLEIQKLQISNAEINLEQKKEQYLSGQLDSGFLDNAIIQRNSVIESSYDIETAKEKLISTFETLSDLDYKTAKVPHLELISNKDFIEHNLVLEQNRAEIEKNRYYKNVTTAKYLPRVSLTAGYNWNDSEQQLSSSVSFKNNNSYYDYGFRVTMPLDINIFRDIESSKIDYLKSKVVSQDKQKEVESLFTQVMHNREKYEKKILLSYDNRALYRKLLEDTKELYKAGYKTKYDVDTLTNSLKIESLKSKMYEIEKQLELLNLYEVYVNNGE